MRMNTVTALFIVDQGHVGGGWGVWVGMGVVVQGHGGGGWGVWGWVW